MRNPIASSLLALFILASAGLAVKTSATLSSSLEHEVMNHRKLLLADDDDGIQGQYILRLETGVNFDSLIEAFSKPANTSDNIFDTAHSAGSLVSYVLFHLQLSNDFSELAVIRNIPHQLFKNLMDSPMVAWVEQDRFIRPDEVQRFAPWHLDKIDNPGQQMNWMYEYEFSGTGVDAYILDSGIRQDHHEFEGRASCGFNAFDGQQGCMDVINHGTHIASILGGKTFGVAKNVTLIAVKVLGGDFDQNGSVSSVIRGIEYVIQQRLNNTDRPAIANLSLGTSFSHSLNDAVDRAVNAGIVFVTSAGNEGDDACNKSPASADRAITVGSIDKIENLKSEFSNGGTCVSIFAPGMDIEGAAHSSPSATSKNSGTSMAAPIVSGVVALYLEQQPDATPEQVWNRIHSDAVVGLMAQAFANETSPDLIVSTEVLNHGGNETDDEGETETCRDFLEPCQAKEECCWTCNILGFCFFV